MTDIIQAVETTAENIFKTVEKDAVVAWSDFLGGITWLGNEARAVAAIAEKLDPGLQQQLQALLTAGEAAAAAAGSSSVGAAVNVVANLAADVETSIANASSAAFGGDPLAQGVSVASVNTLKQISSALETAVPIGVAKMVGQIAAAAAATPNAPTPAPAS